LYGGFIYVLAINDNRPTHKRQYKHMFNVGGFKQLDNPHIAWRVRAVWDCNECVLLNANLCWQNSFFVMFCSVIKPNDWKKYNT